MKISIDARSINWSKGTGIGTYTYNIIQELGKINSANEYLLFWTQNDYNSISKEIFRTVMTSNKHSRFFDNIYIPKYIAKNNIDLYHIPQNGIGLNSQIQCKKIVTIHDLIPYVMPETVGSGYLKKFLESMPEIIGLCDGIITVSEYSKSDILKFFPSFDKDKIFVTPLATNENYHVLDRYKCKKYVQNKFDFSTDYILYIGGFSARKNVKHLIYSFKKSLSSLNKEIKLVLVGALRDEGEALKKYTSYLHLDDHVIFTGYVDDDMLPILYNGCDAFIYPSLYEGFGLPPLEAMSCGAPVITSNTTSIPEVISDCGMLINPHSRDSLAKAIVKLINDPELRLKLSILGLKHSESFSWSNTAMNTIKAYNAVLDEV